MEYNKNIFSNQLKEILGEDRVLIDEPMCKHTTFRIGGPAEWFVLVHKIEELQQVTMLCKEQGVLYYVIGNGSDLLVSDTGVSGVIIRLAGDFETIELEEIVPEGIGHICAGAGAMLSSLALRAGKKGFTGLEFASGIPGTVGGAVLMNAGAYGGEIKDTIVAVDVLTKNGIIKRLERDALDLSYRHSAIMESGDIVLKAHFSLSVRPKIHIFAVMESYKKSRQAKQPLEYPSAGSTFKRGTDFITAKLIDECGLKGYQIGGAQISEKHAGFIINKENATAEDVIKLMEYTKQQIYNKFGKIIEPEIEIIK